MYIFVPWGNLLMRMTGLAVLLLLAVPVVARADTFETFTVNSTAGGGVYSVTGTLTFDATNLTFTDSNLVTSYGPVTGASTVSGPTLLRRMRALATIQRVLTWCSTFPDLI